MKIASALLATALAVQITMVTGAEYHMKSVKVIHARAQGDTPVWDTEKRIFTSSFGKTFEQKYRAALDTVNTASVEGSLMYVQAECIDVSLQSVKCERKNKVNNMVFYEIDIVQTNETLAQFQETTPTHEYGPMLPMDGGRVTPAGDKFPVAALMINGDDGTPNIGPFVGGEDKSTNPKAPYPGTYWFSFPNTAPLETWGKKTDENRAKTRQGLCDYDVQPDGVKCTFNYKILGYISIDDVVGITALKSKDNENYKNFNEFCLDGGVEFKWNNETNTVEESIDFWKDPTDSKANAERAQKLVDAYNKQIKASRRFLKAMVNDDPSVYMTALPTVPSLTASNPKCYENVEKCAKAEFGCKREGFSQLCTICSKADGACVKAPENFVFPTLVKAKGEIPEESESESGSEASSSSSSSKDAATPTPAPTPAASSAAAVGFSLATVCASLVLSYFA